VTVTGTDGNGNTNTCIASVMVTAIAGTTGTLYVDMTATGANDGSSWTNAFTDLQDALNATSACGAINAIWVAAGTYIPHTSDRNVSFEISEGVSLQGGFAGGESTASAADPTSNPTILSGDLAGNDIPNATGCAANNGENSYTVVSVPSNVTNATSMNGFTITGGKGEGSILTLIEQRSGGGLDNWSSATFENMIFEGNCSVLGGAVYAGGVNNNSDSEFINCIFRNNHTTLSGGAVYNDGRGSALNTILYMGFLRK